jgi:hypothetical protein
LGIPDQQRQDHVIALAFQDRAIGNAALVLDDLALNMDEQIRL